MANVTAAMVKELRERTGAGMMDCKKALVAADGDIELAIDNMRKSGVAKAAKKEGRIAAEGIIVIKANGNKAAMVEVNCETDFVAKNPTFKAYAETVAELALANNLEDVDAINALTFNNETVAKEMDLEAGVNCLDALKGMISKIGENMKFRRVKIAEASNLGSYVHMGNIGALVQLEGGDAELAKQVCMHVCAQDPRFCKPEDVSAEVVEHERKIQVEIAMQSGKPQNIAEKMVEGRMKKFTGEVSLTGQAFVMDPNMTVGELLKSRGADVLGFTRFKVGEGIEKQEVDFASEVAAQVAAAQAKA